MEGVEGGFLQLLDQSKDVFATRGNFAIGHGLGAAEAIFHVLSFLEIWLSIWLVTGQSLPLEALVLDAFGRVANVVFKVVPLQLGVLQVGSELVATAIGLAPGVGTTLSLVRTARVLFWAAAGLAFLGGRLRRTGSTEGTGITGPRGTERGARGGGHGDAG